MESIIGVVAILVAIMIALVPYFKPKFLSPKLTIEVISDGGMSTPMGLSNNNDFSQGFVDDRTANKIFELTWKFKIVIRNNSDLTALYPEMNFNPEGPKLIQIEKLNRLHPIKPAETLTLKAEYKRFEEASGDKRTGISENRQAEFEDLGILLSYENSKNRRFYTVYNHGLKSEKNKFINEKPCEYRNN